MPPSDLWREVRAKAEILAGGLGRSDVLVFRSLLMGRLGLMMMMMMMMMMIDSKSKRPGKEVERRQ
jgi:hypothetical protein